MIEARNAAKNAKKLLEDRRARIEQELEEE